MMNILRFFATVALVLAGIILLVMPSHGAPLRRNCRFNPYTLHCRRSGN
jgi:hypothetical protein